MRNMAVLHSPAFSYPLPVLVRVLSNLLIFKGKILYYNKYTEKIGGKRGDGLYITSFCMKYITIYPGQTPDLSRLNFKFIEDKL